MVSGYPDWTDAVALVGRDPDGNPVLILVDAEGRLTIPMQGEDPGGALAIVAVDADGQIIMVPRGQSGNYLSVDASGYLTTVLKGVLNGTLTTVAVDESGYLAAYVLDDESQWGDVIKVGNAELAARLGAPTTWDWRGKVLWQHDFSNGWQGTKQTTSGTGASVALAPGHTRFGGYSAKLTGGSTSGLSATVVGYGVRPPSDTLGFTTYWQQEPTPVSIRFHLHVWIDEHLIQAQIRHVFATGDYEYLDEDNTWQTLASIPAVADEYTWHCTKLVANFSSQAWVRAILDNTEVDMTQTLRKTSDPDIPDHINYGVTLYSSSGFNKAGYVDVMFITSAEPE